MTRPISSVAPVTDDPGVVAVMQVLAWAEEGDVDAKYEVDGGIGHDEEGHRREHYCPGRLRLEELDVGAQARHGWIHKLVRVGD
jgi:hypothetical protein